MLCVVCGQTVGAPLFANAWEESLRLRACCSEACVDAFDPDVHWIPSVAPTLLDDDETDRTLDLGKARLRDGDDAGVVAKDLLIAGVESWIVRKALAGEGIAREQSKRTARAFSLMNVLGGTIWLSRDRRRRVRTGFDVVDEWEQRFGLQSG